MRPDDYTAGVDLFQETGSLIARPQQIVPVTIVPAVLLWVPISANIDGLVTGFDPGYSQDAYGWPSDLHVLEIPRGSEVQWIEVSIPPLSAHPIRNIFRESLLAFVQEELRPIDPPNYVLDEDLVATLLDLARAGDEAAFRALALMRGVPAAEIQDMWQGTVTRVGKAKPA